MAVIGTLLEQITDFDRDGYSLYSFPLDRQPFDGSRHPYALDIPNDGIDQDGLAGDFSFSGSQASAPAPVIPAGQRPNVILIVLESTRADAIGRRVDGRAVRSCVTPVGSLAGKAIQTIGEVDRIARRNDDEDRERVPHPHEHPGDDERAEENADSDGGHVRLISRHSGKAVFFGRMIPLFRSFSASDVR